MRLIFPGQILCGQSLTSGFIRSPEGVLPFLFHLYHFSAHRIFLRRRLYLSLVHHQLSLSRILCFYFPFPLFFFLSFHSGIKGSCGFSPVPAVSYSKRPCSGSSVNDPASAAAIPAQQPCPVDLFTLRWPGNKRNSPDRKLPVSQISDFREQGILPLHFLIFRILVIYGLLILFVQDLRKESVRVFISWSRGTLFNRFCR